MLDFRKVLGDIIDAMPGGALSAAAMQDCPVDARILQGNPALIGKVGAFPGHPLTAGGAAVIPEQWGGKSALSPNLGGISGQFQGPDGPVTFNGVDDVVGGVKKPEGTPPGMDVRQGLQRRYPGQLIIELPGQPKDFGTLRGSVRVPSSMACPVPPIS